MQASEADIMPIWHKSWPMNARNAIEEEQWSPEEIAGYCKANGIEMASMERIYQFIRADKRNGGHTFHPFATQAQTPETGCFTAGQGRHKRPA